MRSTRRRARRGLALALGVLGLALTGPGQRLLPDAAATSMVRLGLAALAARAHVVAHATVEQTSSRFLDVAGGTIVTDVRLRVRRGLLGVRDGERITIQHLGGTVGEFGQIVHGEASYRVGEEVVVLAAPRPGGLFTVGMTQGALHVRRDAAGAARVHVDAAEAELLSPPLTLGTLGPVEQEVADGMPLEALLQRLAALIAARPVEGAR